MSHSPSRPDIVEKLIQGAQQGMLTSVQECSANEVLSAYFTMTRRAVRLSLAANPGPLVRAALQHSIMELLSDCAEPTQQN